ncbi:MAG: formylglycine-generating enzyme family protein [Magnetococcales bacterium]|nr:formylglycine-generating enzyme family protein [Magnetococcales bacterium]
MNKYIIIFCILIHFLLFIPSNTISAPLTLDIDDNGHYDALTDGLLVTRFLMGMRGSSLIQNVVDSTGQRTDAATLEEYLAAIKANLDLDCDGTVTAQSDGVLIMRRLFGFSGSALTAGLNGLQCPIETIMKNINALTPQISANHVPTISSMASQTTSLNTPTPPIGFTIADQETSVDHLTIDGHSSNTTLIPDKNLFFEGTGGSRTMTAIPANGQSGSATITLSVSDGKKQTSTTVTITVTPGGNTVDDTLTNRFGMTFKLLPSGRFTMGSPANEPDRDLDEGPQHTVTISTAFYMQTTEVTQGQWQTIMGSNPSNYPDCGRNCPVEQVSWDDIQRFLSNLNAKGEGTYRLPTEAEWEYAARAGTTTPWSLGERVNLMGYYAWYDSNSGSKTHPVAQKLPNPWGLFDMHGNVWEWVEDGYDPNFYANSPQTDPTGSSSSTNRVARGGSWGSLSARLRSAYRYNFVPEYYNSYLGFRLVRIPTL